MVWAFACSVVYERRAGDLRALRADARALESGAAREADDSELSGRVLCVVAGDRGLGRVLGHVHGAPCAGELGVGRAAGAVPPDVREPDPAARVHVEDLSLSERLSEGPRRDLSRVGRARLVRYDGDRPDRTVRARVGPGARCGRRLGVRPRVARGAHGPAELCRMEEKTSPGRGPLRAARRPTPTTELARVSFVSRGAVGIVVVRR